MTQEQPTASPFSVELDARRRAAGLSFEQIIRQAERQKPSVALSKSTLSEWFSGRSVPRSGPAFSFLTALLDTRTAAGPDNRRGRWEALRKAAQESKAAGQQRDSLPQGRLSAAGQPGGRRRLRLGRVPGTDSAFVERKHGDALSEALRSASQRQTVSRRSSRSAVAGQVITGTGGVGKSQLAARYCQTDAGDADLVMWVTANSTPAVTGAYAQAARALELGVAGEETSFAAEQFLNWLSDTACSWLVVLDDVLSPGALDGWWPPQQTNGYGRVIVTTRSREGDLAAASGHPFLPIGVFAPEESLAHLHRSLNRPGAGTDEDLAGLAEDLGHLPLALSRAAAFLDFNTTSTVAGYRALLADRRLTLERLTPPVRGRSSSGSLAALWDISVEQADLHTRGAARPMMELAAFLDGTAGIPDRLFTTDAACGYLTDRSGSRTPAGTFDAEHTLSTLDRLNLLDHTVGLVHVHQLIQRAVREYQPPSGPNKAAAPSEEAAIPAAADALLGVWPGVETDQGHAQRLRANAQALIGHDQQVAKAALWLGGNAHGVLYRLGTSTGQSGDVLAAAGYFDRLSRLMRHRLGPDHPDTLAVLSALARWQSACGNHASAISILEDLVSRQSVLHGADSPITLTTRHNLAVMRGEAGGPAEAVAALEDVLAVRRRTGAEPAAVLATRHNHAYWMILAGQPEKSFTAYRELIPEMEQEYGADDERTLTARHNLSRAQGESGDPAGAVATLEALLPDQVRSLGPMHPRVLFSRQSLGRWQGESGQITKAMDTYQALIPDMEKVFSPDYPELLTARHNFAVDMGDAGHPHDAVPAMRDVVAARARILGPHHPDTFSSRHSLAKLRRQTQGPASVVKDFEDLLHDQHKQLPPAHPAHYTVRYSLAKTRGAAGDLTGAIVALHDLLIDLIKEPGPGHRLAGGCLSELDRWQQERADASVAALMYRDLLCRINTASPGHPVILHLLDRLAMWQGRSGDPARALQILARMHTEAHRLLGPEDPTITIIASNIAYWSRLATAMKHR